MSLQFTVEIEPSVVREATRGIFWRQVTRPRVLAGLGALLLLSQVFITLLFRAHQDGNLLVRAALTLLMLLSLGGLAEVAARHYVNLAQANFARFKGAPVAVSLDPDAYRYRSAWGEGAIPWEHFDSLWRFRGVWVLLQHSQGGVSVLLPAAGLSEEARAFITARLKAAH